MKDNWPKLAGPKFFNVQNFRQNELVTVNITPESIENNIYKTYMSFVDQDAKNMSSKFGLEIPVTQKNRHSHPLCTVCNRK